MYQYGDLYYGVLIRRYKRFFADIQLDNGDIITAHNPNTGSMRSLLNDGAEPVGYRVLYSKSCNQNRKLPYTLELINVHGEWIVSNTTMANKIVESAFDDGSLHKILQSAGDVKREYMYGDSRFDFYIEDSRRPTFVEVKSVTYFDEHCAYFPDAVTARGLKHLETLQKAVLDGYRAIMLYVCMVRRDSFACAWNIDSAYCETLEKAEANGVEKAAVYCLFNPNDKTARIERY